MAITPTNSNTTSIINLPQAQIAVGSDLLILQTTNGTQTVTFDKFNVVKTDVLGNATVVNNLSVTNTNSVGYFNSIVVNNLSAATLNTAAGPGITLPSGFYNQFTIQNGIVLSAASNVFNDPVYVQLYNNDIPQFVQGQIRNAGVTPVIERSGNVLIPAGSTSFQVTLDNFFANPPNSYIAAGNITPAHFNLTTDYIPTTGSVSLFDLTALQSLTALVALSGVNSGFLTNVGGSAGLTTLMSSLTSPATISLLTGSNTASIPSYIIPIIKPFSIASATSSDGSGTALTFNITIGTPQTVDVTVYWKFSVVAPLMQQV
jgi:hypothetical protein